MKIVEKTEIPQVEVYFKATDDAGDYSFQHTYQVAGTLPALGTKERTAWNAARLVEQKAIYGAWKAWMVKPVVPPTKKELEAQLARVQQDKVLAEAKIVELTAAISAAVVAEPVEEPLEDVKVG